MVRNIVVLHDGTRVELDMIPRAVRRPDVGAETERPDTTRAEPARTEHEAAVARVLRPSPDSADAAEPEI